MYKNIEVLNKEKFKGIKFTQTSDIDVAKNIGIIPIGYDEIIDMSSYSAVIIMGEEDSLEFVAFTGISSKVSVYNRDNLYMPKFVQTYPFVNTRIKDENDKLKSVIGIDNGSFVSKKKKNYIFNKEKEIQELANDKINMLKKLNSKRDVSKQIVASLKEKGLLLQKDFNVKFEDREKTIIEKFYIINREKLFTMDNEYLINLAKEGVITLIDCHIKSLANFKKVLEY